MAMMHAQSMAHRAMSSKDAPNGNTGTGLRNSRTVCAALNRIIVAGHNEVIALRAANRIIFGDATTTRLSEQARRRLVFQRDLGASIARLGGTPANNASLAARLAIAARRVHAFLIGPHQGDAYAVCARATERVATAYWRALKLPLPLDVRFGLEQQYGEVEQDRQDLRRQRWGGGPSFAH